MELGPRFDEAIAYTAELHRAQTRKSTDVPYLSHLLGTTALVLQDGGDEDQAISALLHDAAEDQGGAERIEEIRARFGDRVAGIVAACSDTLEDPKPPWRPRKEAYLRRIRKEHDGDALRVSLADKLDNARAILRDLRLVGQTVWDRFTAGRDEQLWYYRSLVEAYGARTGGPLFDELGRVVAEIDRLVRST